MNLVIVRHAIAEDREAWEKTGQSDAERPLTQAGKRKMRRVADGLSVIVKDVDVLGTSPFVRARQTAKVIGKVYGVDPERVDALVPDGKREDVLDWLREQPEEQTVAIVGHEPSLGLLTSWLLSAPLSHFIEYGKGGAAMLQWSGSPEAGAGWIRWLLTAKQLRAMAK